MLAGTFLSPLHDGGDKEHHLLSPENV